ncbi:hypothetical protein DCE93_01540 [Agromyces badenianii]|uniref:Uncharacterized protein n=1 Tax=Agromyces badenianii TaxID=2080742 RepID=A0A2S0WT38_9MICO|nr:hypothetical protein [Agromyces badenianii]AWB94516.1 hypothetical protein DCE93_01540 [Agromyces badenianii]
MNTALIASGASSVGQRRHSTLIEWIARRAELSRDARTRRAELRHSREELAALHERRQEAARLREERFREVTFARLM